MPKKILNGHEAISVAEYLKIPNKPQPYLVESTVYLNGKTVLVGKPKVGKSWLTLKIGISVALGESVLGLKVNQANVLYLEFDRRFLLAAIHEIAAAKSTDRMEIVTAPATPLNEEEGYRLLLASVLRSFEDMKSPLLVIIDHKSACFSGTETEDRPNRKWLETLDRVNRQRPVSYLVLCQAPKGWGGELVDLPFGSRLLTAWADTVMSLKRTNNRDTRILEMISNYGEIDPITYTKDFKVVDVSAIEKTKVKAAMTIFQDRWSDFTRGDISRKVRAVADEVGCGYSTVWTAYREVKKVKLGTTDETNLDSLPESREKEKR